MEVREDLRPRKELKGELFQSKFMETITRTNIYVPVTMHTLIAIAFLYYSFTRTTLPTWQVAVLFFAGWITWTLAEYWVHRSVYHTATTKKWWLKIQHVAHGIHHQYPRDPERLAMPPLPALVLISIFFAIFYLIMGGLAIAFFPGFLIGYMLYLLLHYAQHRWRPPKYKPFKELWRLHALHHYKYPETKAFGVSTRLWDYVFQTIPEDKK
jgi:sterol desaturase/sphingolipid hydroxylase (fatty acid hydroxylase superfamily)